MRPGRHDAFELKKKPRVRRKWKEYEKGESFVVKLIPSLLSRAATPPLDPGTPGLKSGGTLPLRGINSKDRHLLRGNKL
jgi:hypothetical protein